MRQSSVSTNRTGGRSPWWWVPSLYFAQGLPYVVVMTVSVIMYKRLGINNTDIALYTSWLYLPWVIKPLWSPIVDMFATKRRWILAMQLLLAAGLGSVAFTLQAPTFFQTSLATFWIVAFLSATHDIASDGFYMLALDTSQQAFYVGIRSTFYRAATIAGQGLLVMLAGLLEAHTSTQRAWGAIMTLLSALFLAMTIYHSFTLPRVASDHAAMRSGQNPWSEFFATFAGFFRKKGIWGALAFMLLYRFPEAQLVKLINPFLLDGREVGGLGLDTAAVGIIYGTVGIIGLTLGGIAGGMVVATRGGLRRWLMPMAWSMTLTCLTFVYLSVGQPQSLWLTGICVFVEQLGYGFGFSAYMLYLIKFSEGPCATAHYAIATGFMALGMMLPGMAAGWLQEQLGYVGFFLWIMGCCVTTIVVAANARRTLS